MARESFSISAQDEHPTSGASRDGIGGNAPFAAGTDAMVARDQLRQIVERVERLEEDKKAISDDIREVFADAKFSGFDTKALRQVIALRKKTDAERQEQDAMRDLYMNALGMLPEFEPASDGDA